MIKYDNCKDCVFSRCAHAGKDRTFVCINGVSCKRTKQTDAGLVRVVHCKDCLYWQDNNGGYPNEKCKWRADETPDADDFCSCGERKENDENG